MSKLNIFLFFLLGPFLALFLVSVDFADSSKLLTVQAKPLDEEINTLYDEMDDLAKKVYEIGIIAEKNEEAFNEQDEKLNDLSKISSSQRNLSDDIYEQKILRILGPAIGTHISNRTEIKIFQLSELGYRGYIAKVKLFDPTAFQVVLAKDQLGELETTSSAAKRKKAILAINGGGFYITKQNGKKYAQMIGNTVIDGKLIEAFNGYPGSLFFAGINKNGQVIGNVPKFQSDIDKLKPYQGVSFTPVLLKDGKKVEIPDKAKETKHPRTIIGKYANDDLIVIVIDGRQNDWSTGISLEKLQDKLLQLGVKDAYNLDGGGSSAMYYNGRILNRPSDGKERPVVNNIVIMP